MHETITLIIGGHEYKAHTTDAFGYRYISDLINEVLMFTLHWDDLRWLPMDSNGHLKGTNYDVHDASGQRISPFEVSTRSLEKNPCLNRVFVSRPIGHNG